VAEIVVLDIYERFYILQPPIFNTVNAVICLGFPNIGSVASRYGL